MPPETDGRLRKGARRREELLAATMRIIGRDGSAAVTQRAVAAEAGLAPGVVLYHFAAVDDLLLAALARVNDRWLAELDAAAAAPDVLAALADVVGCAAEMDHGLARAENELWLLASRRADLRAELVRWDTALAAVAAEVAVDPVAAEALVLTGNGLFLRTAMGDPVERDAVLAVLRRVAGTEGEIAPQRT